MTRTLAFVIFPDFQLLDAAGPISVFEIAGRLCPGAYDLRTVAADPGPVRSSAGVALVADPLPRESLDTILVAGGEGTRPAALHGPLLAWLAQARPRRMASICSGAYVLAEAGLLDGRRATTHWRLSADFARRYPRVRLDPDRIFVRDGETWTSAGITAGIDLALALVAEDLGEDLARDTARQLVVHHRRTGGQSQFSALTELGGQAGRFADLMDWMGENLAAPLTVETLADRCAMSPRHFARAFRAETGVTPAKAVERLRLEAARLRVEQTPDPIDRVAEQSGFGDAERMRRAFIRTFGRPPQSLRRDARA